MIWFALSLLVFLGAVAALFAYARYRRDLATWEDEHALAAKLDDPEMDEDFAHEIEQARKQ